MSWKDDLDEAPYTIERKYNPDDFPEPVRSDMIALYEAVENNDRVNIGSCATNLFYSIKHMGVYGIRPWSVVDEMQEFFGVYI